MRVVVVVGVCPPPSPPPVLAAAAAAAAAPQYEARRGPARRRTCEIRTRVCVQDNTKIARDDTSNDQRVAGRESLEQAVGAVSPPTSAGTRSASAPPRAPRRGHCRRWPPRGPGWAARGGPAIRCIGGMFKYTIHTDINVLKSTVHCD